MVKLLAQVKSAIQNLDPGEVRQEADRDVRIRITATTNATYEEIEDFLVPPTLSDQKRIELLVTIYRSGEAGAPDPDIEIYEQGNSSRPSDSFAYFRNKPSQMIEDIVDRRGDLALALSRRFPAFRACVVKKIIHRVSRENALFSLATALPDIVPSLVSLPWAVGEWASDTAFLTVNQIRMAFLLAAASDREIGYSDQKTEIASIVASAFGWRAIARELVGKIPLGGGLIPKAAIAYAGTWVVGSSMERFYRIGYGYTSAERRDAYQEAFERGKSVAKGLLEAVRPASEAKS